MVTRNYGNAPSRNIFKRRVRFLFGQLTKKYPDSPIGLMVKPLHERVSYISLKEGFSLLEKKIKLEGGSF
jgi:RNase P protein component